MSADLVNLASLKLFFRLPLCLFRSPDDPPASLPPQPALHHSNLAAHTPAAPHHSLPSSEQEATETQQQRAWQQYWNQWHSAMAAHASNKQPALTVNKDAAADRETNDTTLQLGVTDGSVVIPHLSIYVEHYKAPTAAQLGRPARQQARVPDSNVAYTQGEAMGREGWKHLCV